MLERKKSSEGGSNGQGLAVLAQYMKKYENNLRRNISSGHCRCTQIILLLMKIAIRISGVTLAILDVHNLFDF